MTASKSSVAVKPNKRKRLSPEARREMILEGAITYYGKNGFDGRTRDLAEYLGISQPLLYRYYPSTSSLMDNIYEVVFLSRWDNTWERVITDRAIPLQKRLSIFYKDYYRHVNRYDVIRIILFSALRGEDISSRYFQRVTERLIQPIIVEFRHTYGLPSAEKQPIHALEKELIFSLHSKIIYTVIREHVFEASVSSEYDFLIDLYVDNFLAGSEDSFQRIFRYITES